MMEFWQWDVNQYIATPDKYTDFYIGDTAYRIETGEDGRIKIPDEVLQTAGAKRGYFCNGSITIECFDFRVLSRQMPPDYTYTESEKTTFDSLTESVKALIADMEAKVASGYFKGDPGDAGYSPKASVSKSDSKTTVKITDKDGEHVAEIDDGFSPAAKVERMSDGVQVTVTDKSGTTAAEVKDGEKGYSPKATVTKEGKTTTLTVTDEDGQTEAKILDGADGISPTVAVSKTDGKTTITFTDAEGEKKVEIEDGYSPKATVSKSGTTTTVTVEDESGKTESQIEDGYTPVKGVDYMTDSDISEMVDKVLTKVTDGTEVAY